MRFRTVTFMVYGRIVSRSNKIEQSCLSCRSILYLVLKVKTWCELFEAQH